MTGYKIPFNKPSLCGNELHYIAQATASGHISGDGLFSRKSHALLEQTLGVRKALLTTSCTHALDMTALLLELEPGDEVILPSFTFCSTANAYALRGAVPVFVDCRPDHLKIDRYIVHECAGDPVRTAVIASIVALGDAIGASPIAEGIESETDLEVVHGLGVEIIQGWLFAPAMEAQELAKTAYLEAAPAAGKGITQ